MKKKFLLLLPITMFIVYPACSYAGYLNDIAIVYSYTTHLPHRSPQRQIVSMSYDELQGTLVLTFLSQESDVQISIYKNETLINNESIDDVLNGDAHSCNLSEYGQGEYTINVYGAGNIIATDSFTVQ